MTRQQTDIVRRDDGSIDFDHYARIAGAERHKARGDFVTGIAALVRRLGALRPESGVGIDRPAV